MPRPIFDIEQYELRGKEPEVFTESQRVDMRKALARVHGQIDWNAQLLGFNGPNYWGRANPKSDHTYNWVGLPETVDEKRQMQTGAFGIYDKDRKYEDWPAPFNRSQIKTSADQKFHVIELDGNTFVTSLGSSDELTYLDDPALIVGGSYVFDCEVEYEILYGGDQFDKDPAVSVYREYGEAVGTRLNVLKNVNGSITIKKKGSQAKPFAFEIYNWRDISDWTPDQVHRQFVGVWGNKGNQFSTDFLFDSLSLHGCEEHYSLKQTPVVVKYNIYELLELVGLSPTTWTGLYPDKFTFYVEGHDTPIVPAFPILKNGVGNPWFGDKYWNPEYIDPRKKILELQPDCNTWVNSWQTISDELYDNGEFPAFCPEAEEIGYDNDTFANAPQSESLLDDYEYNDVVLKTITTEGLYNRNLVTAFPTDCDVDASAFPRADSTLNNGTFAELYESIEFNITYDLADEGIYDRIPQSGLENIELTWEAINQGGLLEPPCVSWKFDAHLDDGTLETGLHNVFPPPDPNSDQWLWADGPWALADDGVYEDPSEKLNTPIVAESEDDVCYPNVYWRGWDDGEFDDNRRNVCECEELPTDPLSTENCHNSGCPEELEATCTADGYLYTFLGPPDYENDCDCLVECCLVDNGTELNPPYTGPEIVDGLVYTAACAPADPPPNITFCALEDYRWIKLDAVSEVTLNFQPSVRNSYSPLRTWKNRVLSQTDDVPTKKGHKEYKNLLVADANRGTEPEDSYRHFIRLPAEYSRNGKEWNRADQICNNQFYFSKPPKLNELDLLEEDPSPRNYYDIGRQEKNESFKVIYHEDFSNSSSYEDFSEANKGGFKGASITHEDARPIAYHYGEVADYDDLSRRSTDERGEWRGSYFVLGDYPETTGHLHTDLENQFVLPVSKENYPTYDESRIKRPNITFPEENPLVLEKNYSVSYAYFTADLSASEEAVFEPQMAHCWRNPLIDSEVEVNDECVYSPLESNTAYLLHPIELDHGKRTRQPREPGEISKAQGTYL